MSYFDFEQSLVAYSVNQNKCLYESDNDLEKIICTEESKDSKSLLLLGDYWIELDESFATRSERGIQLKKSNF
jgi:hypothetical protein